MSRFVDDGMVISVDKTKRKPSNGFRALVSHKVGNDLNRNNDTPDLSDHSAPSTRVQSLSIGFPLWRVRPGCVAVFS